MINNLKKDSVFVASDHAGFQLKEYLNAKLLASNFQIKDLGCDNAKNSVDYPDFARKVAQNIQENPNSWGILVCGSGIGMAIAVNRYSFIRAAVIHNSHEAVLARSHNNINVVCFGGRFIDNDLAFNCVKTFIAAPFESGRHQPRVDKLGDMPYKGNSIMK